MSEKHPIVAITGSSGAGTTTVMHAFGYIFRRLGIDPAVVEGDCFHRFNRQEMKEEMKKAHAEGRNFSHFGAEANVFDRLEALFRDYGESGTGKLRHYIHDEEEAERYGAAPGTFTDWEEVPPNSDLLFYEGLHGGVVTEDVNVAQYVDLLVGVTPVVNLEWIQKIHRDTSNRGYTPEVVTDTILRRMHDYVNCITPQFSRTHINFQRVPLVDTSNPFIARDVPTPDESVVVIRFNEYRNTNFPWLLQMLPGSFMSRPNTLVVPGGKMGFAMELIFTPIIENMMRKKQQRNSQ